MSLALLRRLGDVFVAGKERTPSLRHSHRGYPAGRDTRHEDARHEDLRHEDARHEDLRHEDARH
ncbi:hypothetical protein [Streptomyces sp. NPDC058424]|uniref:hypothetical protein n=1 Tax=Streptomyces sp. NPDC058424 TaxID=3346491 RepID=UPI0036488EE0